MKSHIARTAATFLASSGLPRQHAPMLWLWADVKPPSIMIFFWRRAAMPISQLSEKSHLGPD